MLKLGSVLAATVVLLSAPVVMAAVVVHPEQESASAGSLGATGGHQVVDRPATMQSLGATGAHQVVDRPSVLPASPAPEPPVWGMLLIGAGIGAFLLRRRLFGASQRS
jgi:hypothetical protein